MPEDTPQLRRSLTLPQVALYGLGNILGAGIYVLIGKVAAAAGTLAPLAFLLSAVVAAITAFSFAELSSRFPLSGGGALYVHRGFKVARLTMVMGVLIVLTGIVSAATIAKGFVGYLEVFVVVPEWLVITILLLFLCGLASWGISESVGTAVLITLIEVVGLILILAVALPGASLDNAAAAPVPAADTVLTPGGLISGAFLAFYAYVGFEDMVNVAEEVKQPQRNMPLAIVIALLAATVLYMLVAISALMVLTPAQLGASEAPLAAVYETVTGNNPWAISVISLFAVVNGALIQIIMGSRVCHGLAREQLFPASLGRVNATTRTPINATLLMTVVILIAALWLPIETLARLTTALLLVVFTLVNLALLRIKREDPHPQGIFLVPRAVPMAGALVCLCFVSAEIYLMVNS